MLNTFMLAIARFEGFYIRKSFGYKNDSISYRHLNPGNLRPVGASSGFRSFSSESAGWDALKRQVLLNIGRGLTLGEFFLGKPGVYPGYAPLADNEPVTMANYIAFVAASLGVPTDVDLRYFFPDLINNPVETQFSWGFPG